jgi:hypothetical protein
MAFDLNNFVIDRVVRGIATDMKTGDVLFSINQITNPSLNCTAESTDAVDALNVPIATFYRAKTAEFSAENALFDMNLLATQAGTRKKVAATGSTIETPCFQTIDIEGGTASYTLSHTPKATPKVYVLNGDGTLGEKVTVATTAADKSIAISGKTVSVAHETKDAEGTVTTPGYAVGQQLFFMYEYDADGSAKNGAIEVANSANNFPVGCKFVMEILGADVCDQTNLIYAYVVFPNFKLSPDFDWSVATDGTHPFSGKAQQDYCDREKKLFSIIIPGEEEANA